MLPPLKAPKGDGPQTPACRFCAYRRPRTGMTIVAHSCKTGGDSHLQWHSNLSGTTMHQCSIMQHFHDNAHSTTENTFHKYAPQLDGISASQRRPWTTGNSGRALGAMPPHLKAPQGDGPQTPASRFHVLCAPFNVNSMLAKAYCRASPVDQLH